MAKGIEKSVQYLLILLGAIVVALAVWMAKEDMWWIAVPDAIFGIGIAWFSWIGLSEHTHHPAAAAETVPAIASSPAPMPVMAAAEPKPNPAIESQPTPPAPAASTAGVTPAHSSRKKKRRR